MRLLWRPLKWLWVVLLLGGIGVPLAGDCVTGLLMGKGCTPWKPALGFLGSYGVWVGLVLLMLAALTLLARRDDRIYQAHEQSQQQLEKARKKFKLLKPSSQLLPEDLGYQRREPGQPISQDKRPFFDTYIHRIAVPYEHRAERNPQPRYDEDALARSLEEGKGFVLLGPPLNGKSRTLYEALRRLDGCNVIRPSSEEKVPDEEVFSRLFKDKRVVVVLDDLTDYVDENKVNLRELAVRLGRHTSSWAVASTCRDGPELSRVRYNERQDFSRFYHEIPLKLTLMEASPQDKQTLAETIGKGAHERDWGQLPQLGEIPMEDPMKEMKARFDHLSHHSPEQRDALWSLKLLSAAGVGPSRERLRAVMRGVFERDPPHLGDCLDALVEQSFLISAPQMPTNVASQDIVRPEPAYLAYVVGYPAGKSPNNDLPRLAQVLWDLDDSEGIFYLAFTTANLFIEQERYQKAIEVMDMALRIQPDSLQALTMRGLLLKKLGRHEGALEALEPALSTNPEDLETFLTKAGALNELGRYEEALEVIDMALRIQPDVPEVLFLKGAALLFLERYEEALEAYDSALAIDPVNPKYLSSKGGALMQLGRNEEALEAYDSALRVNPDDPETLNKKGLALVKLGLHKEALEAFDAGLRINPDAPHVLFLKGSALMQLGSYEEALEWGAPLSPDSCVSQLL